MPYTAEHKARTRERIVANARVLFNRRGFEQVSIDDIMKHSGLTRGGLRLARLEARCFAQRFGRRIQTRTQRRS